MKMPLKQLTKSKILTLAWMPAQQATEENKKADMLERRTIATAPLTGSELVVNECKNAQMDTKSKYATSAKVHRLFT